MRSLPGTAAAQRRSSAFFDLADYGNGVCNPIFRLDFRPKSGDALAHRHKHS
jgi:hypothetical protein